MNKGIFNQKIKPVVFSTVMVVVVMMLVLLFYSVRFLPIASYSHKDVVLSNEILLFYSKNCENCTKVDNFIKNNNIEKKVTFTRLEVVNDNENTNLLADKAQACGISPKDYGVPFLWDGKNCSIGYVDVIKFFKQAAKIK